MLYIFKKKYNNLKKEFSDIHITLEKLNVQYVRQKIIRNIYRYSR